MLKEDTGDTRYGKDVESTVLMGMPSGSASLESSVVVSGKVKHILWTQTWQSYSLSTYSTEMKTHIHTKICMGMFAVALFVIANN